MGPNDILTLSDVLGMLSDEGVPISLSTDGWGGSDTEPISFLDAAQVTDDGVLLIRFDLKEDI